MEPGHSINVSLEWIQMLVYTTISILTGAGAIITVTWKLAQHEKKLRDDFTDKIESAIKNGDTKRARIYERLDEYKNFSEASFIRKDMCGIMHTGTAQEIGKVYGRLDGFDRKLTEVDVKLDELKTLIMQGVIRHE